jgi:hypothetical protein
MAKKTGWIEEKTRLNGKKQPNGRKNRIYEKPLRSRVKG